ncbi:MAG: hypothetical protein H7281_09230 [Bacteriovorax sp.]|nr:hypothetical protein [Bacteriovorax sp.]
MINIKIHGASFSSGKAIGKAFLLNEDNEFIVPKYISSFDLEQARLGQAIQSLELEISQFKELSLSGLNKETTHILNSYKMVLRNPELLKQTLLKIKNKSLNAEWALNNTAEQFIATSETNTTILRDVTSNLIYRLLKKKKMAIESMKEPVILVTRNLSLIQLLSMNPKNILGIIIELEEISKYVVGLIRSLAIPAISTLQKIPSIIKSGDQIILDADEGSIVINNG